MLALATASAALAAPTPFADPPKYTPPAVIPPPTELAVANSRPRPVQEYDYTPRINRPVPASQAVPDRQKIVERFRELYATQNKPRLLLYINRDLAATRAKERPKDAGPEDKDQVIRSQFIPREIEDAFGSVLQAGGALIVDRHFVSLNTDKDSVRKDADFAIELLIEERAFTADYHGVTLPVMTATAIRLSDSQCVARVTSMGLFGLDSQDANANLTSLMVRMTPSEIAQEVAIALMRDLNHAWEK